MCVCLLSLDCNRQVTPLLEGSAAAGSTAAWHDQQQQHGLYSHSSSPRGGGGAAAGYLGSSSGAYASGVVSYGASPKQGAAGFKVGGGALNPAAEGGKVGQHGSGTKGGGGLALMQVSVQWVARQGLDGCSLLHCMRDYLVPDIAKSAGQHSHASCTHFLNTPITAQSLTSACCPASALSCCPLPRAACTTAAAAGRVGPR